MTHINGKN